MFQYLLTLIKAVEFTKYKLKIILISHHQSLDIKGLTTEFEVFTRVVWNRVSFLVIITHECAPKKLARDSIPHGKHLERGY